MIEYDAHSWRDHLLDIRGSMVREIIYRVLSCVIFSVGVVYIDRCHVRLGISEKAHGLVGLALGLLLVFRTNAAYDRYWEGRKLWGAIVNETRNLGRAASVFLGGAPDLLERLLHLAMAFPWAVMCRLRDRRGLDRFEGALPAAETAALLKEQHIPLAVAARISGCLKEARERGLISDYVLMTLDQNVQLLVDYMGGCERIHRTPIPFAYVVHLRRALILYCFTLPFALLPIFGWGTIPATLLLAYVLFGIEEIGVEISDPFGTDDNDLPLEQICSTIEANLRAFLPPSGPLVDSEHD
jgi:putative membrane protein